jgi:CheY-like chemotaxis protein
MTRILLIDDDDAVREVTTEVLRQAGHTVTAAPNAKTGLAHQHTDPHDLIITDINMPDMDGLELIMALRHATPDRITGRPFATRSEVIARHGMVATSQPLATQVGLDVLKAGGSAVDAAIAANAALGLMEPTGCGVGGDLFAIVWSARDRKLYGLNASGRSPRGQTLEALRLGNSRRNHDSAHRPAAHHRARRGRRLVRAAPPVRPPADGRAC